MESVDVNIGVARGLGGGGVNIANSWFQISHSNTRTTIKKTDT